MTKKKYRGHFCWCCERVLPNERFSGSGHARHVCKDCQRLGPDELRYRQDLRDLDRLATWEGFIGRRQRKTFNRFLEHPDPRIRQAAENMAVEDRKNRALRDRKFEFMPHDAGGSDDSEFLSNSTAGIQAEIDDDIPF